MSVLCTLDDLEDPGSLACGELMVIRKDNKVFAYLNRCPHIGAPLDFEEGRFLNQEKTHILCSTHYALFRIEDGMCVHGPCLGKTLSAEPVEIADGIIRRIAQDG